MEISPDEIADILEAINKLDCASVEVTVGEVSIVVRRTAAPDAQAAPAAPAVGVAVPEAAPHRAPAAATPAQAAAAATNSDIAAWLEQEAHGKVRIVRAPMVGTFYSARAPGEPPFVEVGASVQQGDTLGLMEVMKLFNSLTAEVAGTVAAIFARNGEIVEYDQPVFAIKAG